MRADGRSVDQRIPRLIGAGLMMMALSLALSAQALAQSAEEQYGERTPPSDPVAEGICVLTESTNEVIDPGDVISVEGNFSVAPDASLVVQDEDGTRGTFIAGENAEVSRDALEVAVIGDPINVSGGDGTLHAAGCPEIVSTTGVSPTTGGASTEEDPSGVASAVMGLLPDTGGLLPVSVLGGLAIIGLGAAILWNRPRH